MTTQTVDAIFADGTSRLAQPPNIPLHILLCEGQRVRLVVEIGESPDFILTLAADVYAGLSPRDILDIEQISLQSQDLRSSRWLSLSKPQISPFDKLRVRKS